VNNLTINSKVYDLGNIDPETPLLWVLRDNLGLVGTKYGCGIAQCGACTVLIDGQPSRACQIPVDQLKNAQITTIEGLATNEALTALQQAWVDHDVPQCGYCQAGQLMSASALLSNNPSPTLNDIDDAMGGNICRCGTYTRIVNAIQSAAQTINEGGAA
jgi:isoquinoline 1-oxidoreductase alpha subunit